MPSSLRQILGIIGEDRSISSAIAALEESVFQKMELTRELTHPARSQEVLASIHSDNQSSFTFKNYLKAMQSHLGDPFIAEMNTIIEAVTKSENPLLVIQAIIDEVDEDSLRPETNVEESFLAEPEMYGPEGYDEIFEVSERDVANIREYFGGERIYSDLQVGQQQLIETLRIPEENWVSYFDNNREASRWHDLRWTLEMELLDDNTLSAAETRSFQGKTKPFSSVEMYEANALEPLSGSDIGLPDPPTHEPVQADPEDLLALKRQRLTKEAGNRIVRELVHEFPDYTNEQLLKVMQQWPMDEPIESHIGSRTVEENYGNMFQMWDEERALKTHLEAGYDKITIKDFRDFTDAMVKANGKNSVLSNIAINNEGEVMVNESFLKSFLEANGFTGGITTSWAEYGRDIALKQIKGLPLAMVVNPIIQYIASKDIAAANFVTLGLGLFDFATTMDPIGLIAGMVQTVVGENQIQWQHKLENQNPTQFSGSRFGKIRRNGRWYPSVVYSVEQDVGFGTRNRKLTMEYGTDLIYTFDGTGKMEPHFTDGEKINFETTEHEMVDNYSKDSLEKYDMLRGWYFFSPEEQASLLDSSGNAPDFQVEDVDTEAMNPYERMYNEWLQTFDIMDNWKNSTIAKATGKHIEFYEDFPTYRGLRDANERFGGGYFYQGFKAAFSPERNDGKILTDNDLWDNRSPGSDWDYWPENKYLINNIFADCLKTLVKTQGAYAVDEDFDKYDYSYVSHVGNTFVETDKPTTFDGQNQTLWSAVQLGTLNLPVADTTEVLNNQLFDSITNSDISQIAKNYEASKAITRYWIGQICKKGGSDALVSYMRDTEWVKSDRFGEKMQKKFVTQHGDLLVNKRDFNIYPWQNKDEGILPDNVKNQLTPEHEEENQLLKTGSQALLNQLEGVENAKVEAEKAKVEAEKAKIEAEKAKREALDFKVKDLEQVLAKNVAENENYVGKYMKVGDNVWKQIKSVKSITSGSFRTQTQLESTQWEFTDGTQLEFDPNFSALISSVKPKPPEEWTSTEDKDKNIQQKLLAADADREKKESSEKTNFEEVQARLVSQNEDYVGKYVKIGNEWKQIENVAGFLRNTGGGNTEHFTRWKFSDGSEHELDPYYPALISSVKPDELEETEKDEEIEQQTVTDQIKEYLENNPLYKESEPIDTEAEEQKTLMEQIRQHLEDNLIIHKNENDEIHAVEIHGETYHLPTTQEYLQEQHQMDVSESELKDVSFIGKTETGEANLYGTSLGQSDGGFLRYAYDDSGNVETKWTPENILSNDNHSTALTTGDD